MKMVYLTNSRLPTERAHGLQIVHMIEAFIQAGAEVEFLIPNRKNPIKTDLFSYYQKSAWPVKKLWCWDLISTAPWLGSIAFAVESLTFALSVRKEITSGDLVYTRDLWPLVFVQKTNQIVYEAHFLPGQPGWLYRKLLKKVSKIVVLTEGLKQDLIALGFETRKILVAPDAVNLDLFKPMSKTVARTRLQFSEDEKIAVYTGHLYAWKGVDTVLEAAALLPEVTFIFVGGTESDQKEFAKKIALRNLKNITMSGQVPQPEVPLYLAAADVLLLPNSAKSVISSKYTSPLKLFEYLAMARPIVASKLPSLEEILSSTTATFFAPDNGNSLAKVITEVLENQAGAEIKAKKAAELVIGFTWKKRAEKILNFIGY